MTARAREDAVKRTRRGGRVAASLRTMATPTGKGEDEHGVDTPTLARRGLEELYVAHAGDAYRLAYVLTGDRDDANDLVQEAFVRIAARFRHLRNQDSFGFYLRRALVNLARSEFRKRSLEQRFVRTSQGPAPQTVMPDVATRDTLFQALLRLPPRQRVALVLRFYEDMTEDQAAAILGTSARAVNALVARGLSRLRHQEVSEDGQL